MSGKEHRKLYTDFRKRHAVAFMASLGGYDDHERPYVPMPAATRQILALASVLGMDVDDLVKKLDAAREKDWAQKKASQGGAV